MEHKYSIDDRGSSGQPTTNPSTTSDNNIVRSQKIPPSNVFTVDITSKFRDAASYLPAGTLVKDEHFTLFEAVGALEIGDPKMDSGCLQEEDSLDDDYAASQPPSPAEMIWLMDELTSREVAWLKGYPLSQTIFTSIHVDRLLWPDPVHLSDASFDRHKPLAQDEPLLTTVLRSFILSLLKSCDLALDMITSQHYYEEEDFTTQLFNRQLLHRFTTEEILTDLEAAIRIFDGAAGLASLQGFHQHISARLKLRRDVLKTLDDHTLRQTPGSERLHSTISLVSQVALGSKHGTPVNEAFSTKIQRRLASTVPPRPVITVDREETWSFWKQMMEDSANVFSVLHVTDSEDLLTAYMALAAHQPPFCAYVRALLQSFLAPEVVLAGCLTPEDLTCTNLRSTTMPASVWLHPTDEVMDSADAGRLEIHQQMRDFLQKASASYSNVFRMFCLNRCRIRRTLCHAMTGWDQIQADAENFDERNREYDCAQADERPSVSSELTQYPLSDWAFHQKLWLARLTIQLGLELRVYAAHELAGVFFHLSRVCEAHLDHLERVSYFVSHKETALKGGGKRSMHDQRDFDECRDALQRLYRHFAWLKATHSLAKSLHGFYVVLQRHGNFIQPETTYSSDSFRHDIRMRPFISSSIPGSSEYDEFQCEANLDGQETDHILADATVASKDAKTAWEKVLRAGWNNAPLSNQDLSPDGKSSTQASSVVGQYWDQDVKAALKASIALGIALTTTKQKLTKSGESESWPALVAEIPSLNDKDHWHAWWPVPRI